MSTAKCTFRFEFERPKDPAQEEEPKQSSSSGGGYTGSGYASGRSIHSQNPRVECDLCPACLESFTDWFTEYDDPDEHPQTTSEPE